MVTTMVHGHDDRVRSYRLLAELAGLSPAAALGAVRGRTHLVPEGDTLLKTAARMRPALQGHVLTRFEAAHLRGDAPKVGERIDLVEARGKNLLIHFEGGLVLRTHLRMTGSWHVYRERERWRKPAVPGPGGGRSGQRLAGRVLPGAGRGDLPPPGRRASGTGRSRSRPVPRRVPDRRGPRSDRRARRSARRAPARRSARHCSTSGSPPASATSTSRRRASRPASTPPRRSSSSTSPRAAACGRSPPASSRPTSARRSAARTPPVWPSTAAGASRAGAAARRSAWRVTATRPGAPTGARPASRRSSTQLRETFHKRRVGCGHGSGARGRGDRSRLRRARGRPPPQGRAGRGHPRRPAQLPHLPAAALPGGDRGPERGRRRPRGAGPVPPPAQRPVPAGSGDRRRLGRPRRGASTDQADLPFDHLVARRRGHRHLLRHPRRGRARVPPLHARRTPPACGTTSCVASRRPTPTRPSSTAAASPSWWSAAGRPASRPPARWPSCSPMVFRKDYPGLDVSRARVVLVEMQDHLLAPVHGVEPPPRARHAARRAASRCGSAPRSRPWRPTTSPSPTARSLPCQTLVWAAGVQANPLAADARPRRRIGAAASSSAPTCGCPTTPACWAIGDIAATPRPPRRPAAPAGARWRCRAGRHVARQIRRLLEARPTEPFRYRDKGTMATIGRRAAVAELPGRHPAAGRRWRGWRGSGLHLVFLVGKRNRAVGAPQLGLELPHLGPRPPPHPRPPDR